MKILFGILILIMHKIENVNGCLSDPLECTEEENGGCCSIDECVKDVCGTKRCRSISKKAWWPKDMEKIRRACDAEKNKYKKAEENRKKEWKRCLDYVKGGSGSGVIADPERTCKDFDFTMNEVYGTKAEDGGNIKFPYETYHKTYWDQVWGRIKNVGGQFKSYFDRLANGDLRVLLEIFDDISDPSSFVSNLSEEGTFVGKTKDGVEELAQLYQKRKG